MTDLVDQRLPGCECKICLIPYNDKDHIPKILTTCGHTLCEMCTVRFWEQGKKKRLACPFCRSVTNLKDAKSLAKNYELLEVLEAQKSKLTAEEEAERSREPGKCARDPSHKSQCYCEQCAEEFCNECFTHVHADTFLARHKKLPIAQKPYRPPKCQLHPQNDLLLLCKDTNCKIENKYMCVTCCCENHTGHISIQLSNVVTDNQKSLRVENNANQQKCKTVAQDMADTRTELAKEAGDDEYNAKIAAIRRHFYEQGELEVARFEKAAEARNREAAEQYVQLEVSEKAMEEVMMVQKEIKHRLDTKSSLHFVGDLIQISRVKRNNLKFTKKKVRKIRSLKLVLPELKIQIVDEDDEGPSTSSST